MIATSLYIAYTEVGSNTIAGCQSRYITPLIYPLFAVLGGSGIMLKFDYRVYNYIVMIIMQSVSMWMHISVYFNQNVIWEKNDKTEVL